MNFLLGTLVLTIIFGALGVIGIELGRRACAEATRFEDGPKPGTPPTRWLVAGCALLGASLAWHGDDPLRLALSALLCVALVACWYTDVVCGLVPDLFTLVPLGIVLLVAASQREWWHLLAAVVPFVPFALAAVVSKGRGMGWGDVKLAALGGAVLGVGTAVLAFAAACLLAVLVAAVRGRRTEPIAFAPYMAGCIGFALIMGMMP